ncbi:MAG: T9SS type A sorting domain-containing protein [Candidatus Cloacimonetes bacterium]|nr:T9SS type A sorting domain-containing protein [Candidatus Cloacimonadota bacterium]
MNKSMIFTVLGLFLLSMLPAAMITLFDQSWNVTSTPTGWYLEGYHAGAGGVSQHAVTGTLKTNDDYFKDNWLEPVTAYRHTGENTNSGNTLGYLRLTERRGYQRAWAYYTEKKFKVLGQWSIELEVRIGREHDGSEITEGADGLALVFIDADYVEDVNGDVVTSRIEGGYGEWEGAPRGDFPNTPYTGAKGYHSDANFHGYSFEWDHYSNNEFFQEYNHWVELDDWSHSGFGQNMGNPINNYYYNDGWMRCKLEANNGVMVFYYNWNGSSYSSSFSFNVANSGAGNYTPLTEDYYAYLGMTASTGGQIAYHEIRNTKLEVEEDDVLAITLSSFNAAYSNGETTLNWTTASESNNLGWRIYRSASENIGQSMQINDGLIEGAGNSTEPTDYSFLDDTIYDFIIDNNIELNHLFWYWLESVDITSESQLYGPISLLITEVDENPGTPSIPDLYGLYANYPNPFNPGTILSFSLSEDTSGKLVIYNMRGEMIIDVYQGNINAEELYTFTWDGRNSEGNPVASGIYLYKLITPVRTFSRKMILMK